MKRLLLPLMLLVASLASFAHDFEVNGIYYNLLSKDDLTCEVAKSPNYNYTGSVVIPEQVSYAGKVFSVTGIGNKAFYKCSKLTSVIIPNSVTSIGEECFQNCSGLTSVTIGNSVTSIGFWAFAYCSGLARISIPNSVTSIGSAAFYGCSGLTDITIPNSVTSIGSAAFENCSGLTDITIPNNVTSIERGTFYGCSGLTSVTIPNSVTSIGVSAFRGCSGLTSITIPNSVTSIGESAFVEVALNEIVCLPPFPPSCAIGTFSTGAKMGVLKVPGASIDAYKAAEEWKDFWNIVALGSEGGGDNPGGDPEKCAAPTITLQNGKIVVATTTEGAECNTSVASVDIQSTKANEISLSGVYTITTYASKSGLWNSESVTATLVWANPTLEGDGIMNMQMKKALLLRSVSGAIVVEGLDEGEVLELYNVSGMLLDKVKAAASTETLGRALQKGQTYIVKAGDRSVKYQF